MEITKKNREIVLAHGNNLKVYWTLWDLYFLFNANGNESLLFVEIIIKVDNDKECDSRSVPFIVGSFKHKIVSRISGTHSNKIILFKEWMFVAIFKNFELKK